MPKKLGSSMKKELKRQFLDYPGKSDNQISREMKLAQSTVSNFRKEINTFYDIEFIKAAAGLFIKKFEEAAEYWSNQIGKLEDLKGQKKIIFKKAADGHMFPDEVDLGPMDILQIERAQADLQSKILYQATQGHVREVIKLMRSGKLSALTA